MEPGGDGRIMMRRLFDNRLLRNLRCQCAWDNSSLLSTGGLTLVGSSSKGLVSVAAERSTLLVVVLNTSDPKADDSRIRTGQDLYHITVAWFGWRGRKGGRQIVAAN